MSFIYTLFEGSNYDIIYDFKQTHFPQEENVKLVFMKVLCQDLGLNLILLYWTFKPKPWLGP